MTFHDFSHNLFKFFITLDLVVTFKNFHNNYFPSLWVFFDFKQFNRHKVWCPPKYVPFVLFNYSSLSYIVLALSSAGNWTTKQNFNFPWISRINNLNSMTFQAWKMKFLNSMTFQVFHDLYEPWLTSISKSWTTSLWILLTRYFQMDARGFAQKGWNRYLNISPNTPCLPSKFYISIVFFISLGTTVMPKRN